MKRLGIAEALRECIRQEMRRDERVFCIGEDIAVPGGWGGAFTVTLGLEKDFPERTINTPISENGFFGVALGAAMMGLRPIADVQTRGQPPFQGGNSGPATFSEAGGALVRGIAW